MARSSAAKVKAPSQSGSSHRAESDSGPQESSAHQASTSVHPAEPPVEPEDAQITGTSRSLQRRVLGLNVEDRQPHAETTAGQHATGSFTGKTNRKKE